MLLFVKKDGREHTRQFLVYAMRASKVLLDSIKMAAQIQLVKKEERRRDAVEKEEKRKLSQSVHKKVC